MKIEIGLIKSKIYTDNPDLLNALRNLYTFKVPGAEFSPQYRSRRWDGRKSYITKTGVFRSGLLERVLTDLEKIDCTPELEYMYDRGKLPKNGYTLDNFEYYDYQETLIKKGLKEKRGVIVAPTGSGKTLIIAGLIKALRDKKIVLLFNAKQLLTQTYEFLVDDCSIENVGLCFGEGFIPGDIMLCTVQSIDKILDTHLEEAEVLMVDECHEFPNGKITLPAIESFPNAVYRFGFTATPPKESIAKYNLEGAIGPVWRDVTTLDLVEDNKLTKPIIQLIDRNPDTSSVVASEDMDYLSVYEEFIVNNEERNEKIKEIVNEIRGNNRKARILILTRSLDHGRTLENLLGESCQFLEGANSIGERYKAISRFRGCRNSSILIGTKILQTGINIKEITHFINARGMKSEIATLQALGRALRKHESKTEVYVYDFLDKEKYLLEHSIARRRHYTREGHTVNIL